MKLYLVVSVPKTAALSFHYDTQRRDNRPIKLPSERYVQFVGQFACRLVRSTTHCHCVYSNNNMVKYTGTRRGLKARNECFNHKKNLNNVIYHANVFRYKGASVTHAHICTMQLLNSGPGRRE